MRAMKRDVVVASLLLMGWSACAGLVWRLTLREYALSLSEPALRQGVGTLGLALALLLAYFPVNMVHHRLGGSGPFVRWVFDVLNRAIGRR